VAQAGSGDQAVGEREVDEETVASSSSSTTNHPSSSTTSSSHHTGSTTTKKAESSSDASNTLDPTSKIFKQSKLFLEKQLKVEREEKCKAKGDVMGFVVQTALSQLTDKLTVSMNVHFSETATPQTVKNVQVSWTSTASNSHYSAALNQVRSALEAANEDTVLVDNGAYLLLPLAACDWPSATTSSTLVEDEEAVTDERVLPWRGLGLDVAGELNFMQRLLKQREGGGDSGPSCTESTVYPTSYNWKEVNSDCLDYVHDQGTCGACYMFASVDSLSDRHCINANDLSTLGTTKHLSEQRALVCMTHPNDSPCSGGTAELAYSYIQTSSDVSEEDWEYQPSCFEQEECSFGGTCSGAGAFKSRCPDFFKPKEINVIENYLDAYDVAKAKCLPENSKCLEYMRQKFYAPGSVAFFPNETFCKEVEAKWNQSEWGAATLLEIDDKYEDDELDEAFARAQERRAKMWPFDDWFGWGRRRAATDSTSNATSASSSSSSSSSQADGMTVGEEVYWKGSNDTIPSATKGKILAASSSTAEVQFPALTGWFATSELELASLRERMYRLCNKGETDRCTAEVAPHGLSSYYAVPPRVACFKEDLYNYGPFFVAFWVYSDFTSFFSEYPREGYARQLGTAPEASWPDTAYASVPSGALGGHAVVLIGWEGTCTYHVCDEACMNGELMQQSQSTRAVGDNDEDADDPSTGSFLEVTRRAKQSARSLQQLRSTRRRRTATGDCWVLRNSWSDSWADEGYFRMYQPMLTGDQGEHIFITAHAALPSSTSTSSATAAPGFF